MTSNGDIASMKGRLEILLAYAATVVLTGGTATSAATLNVSALTEPVFYESVGTTVDMRAVPIEDIKKEIEIARDILRLISSDDFEQTTATDRYVHQLADLVRGPLDRGRISAITSQLRLTRLRLCNDTASARQWLAIADIVDPGTERHTLPARFVRVVAENEPVQDLWEANADPDLDMASDIRGRDDADSTRA